MISVHPKGGGSARDTRVSLASVDMVSGLDKCLLALLKYPFYPLFNFDNDMNLISKSLTILTSAQLLVVFTFAHIF